MASIWKGQVTSQGIFLQCDCKPTKLFLKLDRCEFVTLRVNKLSNLPWLCKGTSCSKKNLYCDARSKQIRPQASLIPNTLGIPTHSKCIYLFYINHFPLSGLENKQISTLALSASCPRHQQPVVLRMGRTSRISVWQSFTPWWPDPLHRRHGSVCQPRASPHLAKVKALWKKWWKNGEKLKQRHFCWTENHLIAGVVSIQVVATMISKLQELVLP